MRCFFFGSLMDPDVLDIVTGRRNAHTHLKAARLHGYARVCVAGESYPALKPHPGACVEGRMAEGLRERDLARILFFENEEFDFTLCRVELDCGRRVDAHVFLSAEHLDLEERPWDFERWAAVEKPAFLALAREWMEGFGALDFQELDLRWKLSQARLAGGRRRTG